MQENPAKTIKPYTQYFKGSAAVYRNALPQFNNELVDIMSLSGNDDNIAYECLDHLLNAKTFSRTIEVDFDADTALSHLYFEARNIRKSKGHQVLGLGYPLLISKPEKDLIALPLFIWPLSLDVTKKKGEWMLNYSSEVPVRLNPYFPHFMMMNFGIDIEPDIQQYFGKAINAEKLAGFCNYLANTLNFQIKSQQVSLMPCPGTSELDSLTNQDTLNWSGIIGNFPHIPSQSNSERINEILALEAPVLDNHHFSTKLLDPWQSSATAGTRDNFITLVEGAPGTGKSHLLKHFATNALANGGKCLIVSEHISALQSIQKSLLSLQLGDLTFLLRDEISDKVLLSEVIKARAKGKQAQIEEMPQALRVLLDRLQRRKETLDAKYSASRKAVFGEKDFAETLGLFLESSQLEPKELLNSYLEENDFNFTEDELENILKA
ncbi:MAG: ATP-binding protein, partial [Bacteroidetes bacterium]